jgi:pimeloyl-ACP methyl ester carboxylesterase
MTMRRWILAACAAVALAGPARPAELPPAAIFTDPPVDAAYPARAQTLHIPTGGVKVNGLAYIAAGAGAHPTVVLFHGMPGNEKNLDLAQAVRRAGWNVVTLNYRGSWGSPGTYRFQGNLADARAVLAWIRTPEVAAKLQTDPHRLVLMGHSMGGWVTAMTAGADPDVRGAIMISAADMEQLGALPLQERVEIAADSMESLAGVTAQSMGEDMGTLSGLGFKAAAPSLVGKPLLILSSDDGLRPMTDALAADIRKRGGTKVTTIHGATNHAWDSLRVRLAGEILDWLDKLPN